MFSDFDLDEYTMYVVYGCQTVIFFCRKPVDEVSVVNRLREANLSYRLYVVQGTLVNKNKLKLCFNIDFL